MNEGLLEAGCDEAGRGPLAGPVYAAAVILPPNFNHPLLNDSKKMTDTQRRELRPVIESEAISWAVTKVDVEEIDTLNILWASVTWLQWLVLALTSSPEYLLTDGNRFRSFGGFPYSTVVHGDAIDASIAAASVLAKTYRDDYMIAISKEYPQYGWEKNMGYPTREHLDAIREYGYTPHHRKSFHPKALEPTLF